MSDRLDFNNYPLTSEAAHQEESLEWWFVQGCYKNISNQQRYFMASIFRSKFGGNTGNPNQGWFLLLSVLDPARSRHEFLSQIDSTIQKLVTPKHKDSWEGNLDRLIVDTYGKEVLKYGPPRPTQLEKAPVIVNTNPFGVVWNNFSIHQLEDCFQIDFVEPDSHRKCSFRLKPQKPRIYIDPPEFSRDNAMAYASYPALSLKGNVDDEKVSGWAWFDHQWGNTKGWFFKNSDKDKLMGWDWLGINLDNGTDLIVMLHRDMESMQQMDSFSVVSIKNKKPYLLKNVTLTPERYWTSETTGIKYPVQWQICIPEIELTLQFEPFADDQEISVFGFMRAIWEGAGKVSGTMGDSPVSGHARLELHGYGYIFDFNKYVDGLIDQIDERIEEYLPKSIDEAQLQKYIGKPSWKHEPTAYTHMISEPVWNMLSRRGKHWRPLFSIFMLRSLGITSELFDKLICVISELPHAGTLIIDDIEDNSQIRRGQQCIHLMYGEDLAINTGNTLYFLPYLILENHPQLSDSQRLRIYEIMVKKFSQAHFGQALDIYWSRNITYANLTNWMNDSIGPKILQMYAYKTAAVVEGLAELACIISRADKSVFDVCTTFGRSFGVAFQIIDDINDFSNSQQQKQPKGQDITNGKLTYAIYHALEKLPEPKRARLQEIFCSKELRKNRNTLEEAIELVYHSGAIESCRKMAKDTLDKEWEKLSTKLPSSEPKIMLRTLCENLLNTGCET